MDDGTGQTRPFYDSFGNPFLLRDLINLEDLLGPGNQSVTVKLETPGSNGPAPGSITVAASTIEIMNFEDVIGSAGGDTIHGSSVRNHLIGGAGDGEDTLVGLGGSDFLYGGGGNDTIWGNVADVGNPLQDVSDGVGDYLIGGAGDDTYYASHLDSIYDMTLPVFETIGDGVIYFDGILLTGGEKVGLNEYDIPSGVILNQGANVALFRDHDNGLQYRVFNAVEMWEGAEQNHWGLAVINENTSEYIWISDVPYDPETGTLGWPSGGAAAATTTSSVETSSDGTTVQATTTGTGSFLGMTFVPPPPIDGTTGDDNVRLTQGDDIYDAGPGNDTVQGRNGNDVLRGGTGDDLLDGGNNDDILEGGAGSDTLKGGNGIDTADYYKSSDGVYASLSNGSGNAFNNVGNIKWVDSLDGIENLAGSSLADRLYGDSGNNVLTGRAGDDWLSGRGGNDVFDGGLGNDRMTGDDGNDLFTGGAGHDQMTGYGGSDVFDGGEGQDTVLLSWITSGDAAVIDMAAGTYEGAAAGNTYISIENFYGTSIATAGDTILGDEGKNYFFGRAGDDTLDGRGGDDVLVGGTGADTLTGGAGTDWFFYASTSESGTTAGTRDLITDFTQGKDYFDLSSIDANLLATGDQAFNFFGSGAFSGSAGELRYEHAGGNTILMGDRDGDAVADFSIEIVGVHDLTINDFGAGSVYPFITGTAGDDTFQAGPGDDVMAGGDGNDVLRGGAGNDELYGNGGSDQLYGEEGDDLLEGDDAPFGVPAADLLDGGPGTDEANYYGALAGVVVSLADPSINTGEAAGDTYVSIENLRGSPFDDTLIGDAGDNAIWGEEGDDTLEGGAGADLLDGGDGIDWASYGSALGGVSVGLETGGTAGDAAGDTLVSIENLRGSAYDDTLGGDFRDNEIIGEAGADALSGGGGSDLLDGGAGGDQLDGGSGTDEVRYLSALAGVVASLADAAINTGDAAGDTYASVENLRGSLFDDELHGDAGYNIIWGEGGNDSLHGEAGIDTLYGDEGDDSLQGGAGTDSLYGGEGNDSLDGGAEADLLDGGAGADEASYYSSLAGITVNLADPSLNTGDAVGDTYISIESLRGTAFDDTLTGDAGDSELHGAEGADTLNGGAGEDTLFGGEGADSLYGGDARDYLEGGAGADLIDGGAGTDWATYATALSSVTVDLSTGVHAGEDAAGDTLVAIEHLRGSAFDDTLIGDDGENYLSGGPGADVLDGKGGRDVAWYGFATAGISVDFGQGIGLTGEAAGDTFVNIEAVEGSDFDDLIIGGAEYSEFDGGAGDDVLSPGGGGDVLVGGTGSDTLDLSWATQGVEASLEYVLQYRYQGTLYVWQYAKIGSDTVYASLIENLKGSDFDDILVGSDEANTLEGGAGNDTLRGGDGDDLHYGGAGDDYLVGSIGLDHFYGGDGVDTLDMSYTSAAITFRLDDGYLQFNGGTQVEDAQDFENVIGTTGADTLVGSAADNRLEGHNGNDHIEGGAGNDYLAGGGGDDSHYGDAGDDYFLGSVGLDHFYGGDGIDTLDMSYTSASITFRLDDGYLQFDGGTQMEDAQDFENVIGTTGDDTLVGSALANRLEGNGGADRIEGGAGNDDLWGGTGADRFVFAAGDGVDTIGDFEDGLDLIEFTGLTFGDLAITDEATGARISFGASDSVLVKNMLAADLTEDDFMFA